MVPATQCFYLAYFMYCVALHFDFLFYVKFLLIWHMFYSPLPVLFWFPIHGYG